MSIEKIRRLIPSSDAIENMMFTQFSGNNDNEQVTVPTASVSSSCVDLKSSPPVVSPTRSDTTSVTKPNNSTSSKLMSWMIPTKKPIDNDASSISSKKSSSSSKLLVEDKSKTDFQLVDTQMLYDSATKDLYAFGVPLQEQKVQVKEESSQKSKPSDVLSNKSVEKER